MATGRGDVLTMKPAQGGHSLRTIGLALVALLLVAEVVTYLVVRRFASWEVFLGVSAASGVFGLIVIAVAIWRYAAAIAVKLGRDECIDDRLASGVLLLLAGVLLVLPGIVCDCLGLVLLVPWTRRFIVTELRRCFAAASAYGPTVEASEEPPIGAGEGPACISLPPRRRAA